MTQNRWNVPAERQKINHEDYRSETTKINFRSEPTRDCFLENHQEQAYDRGPFGKFFVKCLRMPKNWNGDPLGFFHHPAVVKHQKIEGGPSRKTFFKRSLKMPNKWKWNPWVSPGVVFYEKKKKTLFDSSLTFFDTIIFRRTFVELFWSICVDWKKELL